MSSIRIRSVGGSDIPACIALAGSAGWRTDDARWRTLLAVGEAMGIEDERGALAASVILNRYDDALAMIAMMRLRAETA